MPCKLHAGLTAQQLAAAEAIGEIQEFAKDQTVFRDGEPGDCMYTVLRGRVAVSKLTGDSRHQLLGTLGPGEYFGEMSVIDSQPRSAEATAVEDVTLRKLCRADLNRLLAINPQILFNLLRGSGERLRAMNRAFIEQVVHQEKMALVGNMASSIIHDFKNPMTVIRINAEILGYEPKNADRARTIMRHVDRVTAMANDLLDFARGAVRLNTQDVNPQDWVAELRELLEPLAAGRAIRLECAVLTGDHLQIDPNRMTRAIYNLAANAVEAMPRGGDLRVRLSKHNDQFHIEVADTGPGIPEEIRDRLFDAFVTFGKKGGTGLGTSIAKKTVEDHGGSISFTTETGRGTTFSILLPAPAQALKAPNPEMQTSVAKLAYR